MHCRIVGKDDFKGTGLHTITLGSELLPAPAPALVVAWVSLTQSPLTVRIGGAAILVLVPGRILFLERDWAGAGLNGFPVVEILVVIVIISRVMVVMVATVPILMVALVSIENILLKDC